jgi:nucleolar protein 53
MVHIFYLFFLFFFMSLHKKKPSKKGKKEWRKNVDINQVEDNIAELRNEEILGGKIHELKSSEIFFTDTVGNE